MITSNETLLPMKSAAFAPGRTTLCDVISAVGEAGPKVLRYLAEAANLADASGLDPWDFAVEIDSLCKLGLNTNHLRWLVCVGLVAQAREITTVGSIRRSFRVVHPLVFAEDTCFVLTALGSALSGDLLSESESVVAGAIHAVHGTLSPGSLTMAQTYPVWDADRQQLRLGEIVVKEFRGPAENQRRILAAFQEEGWPVRIDDPLPPHPAQDPRRRLHDTIVSLNRKQLVAVIRFHGDGSGEGVLWRQFDGARGATILSPALHQGVTSARVVS